MENNSSTLGNLLEGNKFRIPDYQRAYAWEEPQLDIFMDDLENHRSLSSSEKPYFLGSFLFSTDNNGDDSRDLHVVDGQQRLTTVILYAYCALKELKENNIDTKELKALFIGEPSDRRLKVISQDNNFFDDYLLKGNSQKKAETPSQKKLQTAVDTINFRIKGMSSENKIIYLQEDLHTLRNSIIITYTVHSESEAVQIFEFQNDRGKKLTNLEVIKSFLMNSVYVCCLDKDKTKNILEKIQEYFKSMYRIIEEMSDFQGVLGEGVIEEDTILSYYMIASLPKIPLSYGKDYWRHPKETVKRILTGMKGDNGKIISWIEDFSRELLETFETVKAIFDFRNDDKKDESSLGGLFVLDRVAPMWPLLIKCWKYDDSKKREKFKEIVKYCSRFSFRSSVAGWRPSNREGDLHGLARDFKGGTIESLKDRLNELCEEEDLKDAFLKGLNKRVFYKSGDHVKYLLWKYENSLRARSGDYAQHPLTWEDMMEKKSKKLQMTVDHIFPQTPDSNNVNQKKISEKMVTWDDDSQPEEFQKLYVDRLGNLILATRAGNASKGNRSTTQEAENSRYGSMQARYEIKDDMEKWDEESIKKRQNVLIDFAHKL